MDIVQMLRPVKAYCRVITIWEKDLELDMEPSRIDAIIKTLSKKMIDFEGILYDLFKLDTSEECEVAITNLVDFLLRCDIVLATAENKKVVTVDLPSFVRPPIPIIQKTSIVPLNHIVPQMSIVSQTSIGISPPTHPTVIPLCVIPIQDTAIARLEFIKCLMLSRLYYSIKCILFTYSFTALCWIRVLKLSWQSHDHRVLFDPGGENRTAQ